MNDHWLKERFKDIQTDDLKLQAMSLLFDSSAESKLIADELLRREQENEQTDAIRSIPNIGTDG